MNFKVSEQAARVLANFADQNHITPTEALSRAIGLLDLADKQRKRGVFLGLVKEADDAKLHAVGRVRGVLEGQ